MTDQAVTTTLIAAVFGLTGIVLGAWLTALLTTRRERWNLKRDLYERLLVNLREVSRAIEGGARVWADHPRGESGDSEEMLAHWERRLNYWAEEESKAEAEIRRVTSMAVIMLNDNAMDALRLLEQAWLESNTRKGAAESENEMMRKAAADAAYKLIAAAAKRDLRL